MNKEQFQSKKQWARHGEASMKRRRLGHDYQGRCIYMITLVVDGRRPLLASVTGNGEDVPAMVHPTALGYAILEHLQEISRHYPAVKVIAQQLMPDHLHFILYVQARIPKHLGAVINGFKVGTNRIYHQLQQQRLVDDSFSSLWEQGYNDRILEGKGHLQRMMDYIDDNPRRLAIKRCHPYYFQVQRNVQAAGYTFAALGNLFLLDAPCRVQVRCSRSLTDQDIQAACRHYLSQAHNGAVLVSPAISPGEKAVMRAAFENGFPVIILRENGFAPLAKPGGQRFDACAQGRLLLLAPWQHHNTRITIKREQCQALNAMAAAIATQLGQSPSIAQP